MYSVKADFVRLRDVPISAAYNQPGVYSLWSGAAQIGPSYIGEGNVLRRFVDHLEKPWARGPIDGVIWLLDWESSHLTYKEAKWVTESVERALLLVADEIGCFPPNNERPGKDSSIDKLLKRLGEPMLRITFTGFDPLRPPERQRMRAPKKVEFRGDTYKISGWRAAPR